MAQSIQMTTKKDKRKVILTPITKNVKSKGINKDGTRNTLVEDPRRDYLLQLELTKKGAQWMWDDKEKNEAHVGDLFGFVHNFDKINFHIIN